jgi:hypothetical protein
MATEEGVRKALSEIEEKPEEGGPGEPEDADAEPF